MFRIFSSGDNCFGNGAISPFGEKYLSSAVPSDSPRFYSVVVGKPLSKVITDISEIHINIISAEHKADKAQGKKPKRNTTANRA